MKNIDSFIDKRNGKSYKTFQIGTQQWMAENLNVDVFRNGESIPFVKNEHDWYRIGKDKLPALCYYYNRPAFYSEKFGTLYNWHAVVDNRGLAPEGWHIPSDEEWSILINELIKKNNQSGVGHLDVGREVKHSGGFNGLMAGSRMPTGDYYGMENRTSWWSSTELNSNCAFIQNLFYNESLEWEEVQKLNSPKISGHYVRCIKD